MLLIHKPHSYKKLLTLGIASICGIGALLGLQTLTYAPELSHAETVDSLEHRTMADITYMQDITPSICKNSGLEKQYQLKDSRDQKTYWVARLKDNNCWMTQNLALDLSTSEKLTDIDSDVSSSGYTPPADTQQKVITKFPSEDDLTISYNPGEYVYTTPMEQNNCGNSGITKLEGCPNWTLVTGLSKDTSGNEQAHYLAGNYYSYEVATAGYTATYGAAPSSICPRGWKIPTGGSNTKDYDILVEGLTSDANIITNNIKLAPYYFVYSGIIRNNTIGLYNVGYAGSYWSSSINAFRYPVTLNFNSEIRVFYDGNRHRGHPIRCVARSKNTNNIEVAVNPTISLDVAPEVVVEKSATNPSTANLDVKVSSNQPYSVNINAKDHAELTSNTTEVKIPSVSGTLSGSSNEWGIKKPEETEYTAVTTTPQLFYQSSVAEIKTIPFIIGISTSPDIPNGEYSTDITITATQN